MMSTSLYDNIVEVLEYYLGPAGKRFVDRQIESHLSKSPDQVTAEDLPELTEWMKVSMAYLTDNQNTIDECSRRLLQLT